MKKHIVRAGDTLSGIASMHGTTVANLALFNNFSSPYRLRIGQVVWIPTGMDDTQVSPHVPQTAERVYTVRAGDTLSYLAFEFDCTLDELVRLNGIQNPNFIAVGQVLRVPARSARPEVEVAHPPAQPASATGALEFRMPLERVVVTQWFGDNRNHAGLGYGDAGHNGIDFGCAIGTPVLAVADGVVSEAKEAKTGYGVRVRLAHTGGQYSSIYGHLSELRVKPGERVVAGQVLGLSGNTGNSTGPHLHFGLYKNKVAIDPRALLFGK